MKLPEGADSPDNLEHDLVEIAEDFLVVFQLNAYIEGLHPGQILEETT